MEKEEVLLIGQVKVFSHPVVMTCFGLGSCVGVFIKDRSTGICGGAHIFLPAEERAHPSPHFDSLIVEMLDKMKGKGSKLKNLRAKLVGGANVLRYRSDVGSMNIQHVKDQLIAHKVFIAAMEVGGKVSRTVRFRTSNESLTVKELETKQAFII